ncbi:MAG: hypothetical protein HS116_25085 [Planctomycetes bacterium]|nr:hypothetical protein [Planctomycetota bacterium]
MNFLQPHEMDLIRRDFQDLLAGLDATPVTLHWVTGSGPKDAYGRYAEEQAHTLDVRAVVNPPDQRAVEKQAALDLKTGDTIFLFPSDVNLDLEGLWFEVPSLGDFVPDAHTPVAAHTQPVLLASGERFAQEVRARPKR